MGKSKKDKPLSHEEIWDDSALVQSWDDAVEEYKLYHSIHAKGENIEDVLKESKAAELSGNDGIVEEDAAAVAEVDIMEADTDDVESLHHETAPNIPQSGNSHASYADSPALPTTSGSTLPTGTMPMPMPGAGFPPVQDENLKRLMMAWYFAGYYTGLYEGQQQVNQSTN
ncbi:hypothetical protein N7462_006418 [Penicillium macrosclerotiorum]|uniref:uncharacterized protein n=1 Tax=Penicillium macrosclerotiorum TaxID=303699 RepID=UPI002547772B|nr:uncharacterized protein N7462_006418 [Penicillium macrosclerotiorum]KAJ5683253.1 hypothetical protein N7462_006418 [Penicillium macrosclerotiorum]